MLNAGHTILNLSFKSARKSKTVKRYSENLKSYTKALLSHYQLTNV